MTDHPAAAPTLKDLIAERDLRYDALGLLARTDKAVISKVANGRLRAQPETVVRLAKALGVSARRMQALCDASYLAAHPSERVSA